MFAFIDCLYFLLSVTKQPFQTLGCSYIANVDDIWMVSELTLKPGEPRICVLQWLFTKFDMRLGEMMDNSQAVSGSKMDSRLQSKFYSMQMNSLHEWFFTLKKKQKQTNKLFGNIYFAKYLVQFKTLSMSMVPKKSEKAMIACLFWFIFV